MDKSYICKIHLQSKHQNKLEETKKKLRDQGWIEDGKGMRHNDVANQLQARAKLNEIGVLLSRFVTIHFEEIYENNAIAVG